MPRTDLLSLSDDDLASLTNRGTVKRARRELDAGTLTYEISDETDLIVVWSDEIRCVFPADQTIHDATCSSGGIGISRHMIRSVLAYQKWIADNEASSPLDPEQEEAGEPRTPEIKAPQAWNPGDIRDDDLVAHFRKPAITRARKLFDSGVLVELTRGSKPTARFLHQSCTIRFPVPDDVRYARGDCSDATLSQWVIMAVWSFRLLPADREAGLISRGQDAQTIPTKEISALHKLLGEWFDEGFAGRSKTWPSRFARSEAEIRKAGLIWPAELMLEIAEQHRLYDESNARFCADQSIRLAGELIARLRAIANPTDALPQALVRGNRSDARSDIRAGRVVGLGLEVRSSANRNTLLGYFQDCDTGNVVVLKRNIKDPDDHDDHDDLPSFDALAKHSISRGVSIGAAAMSQLMLGGGKRTPTDELILPRSTSRIAIHPQSFQWEHLLPPISLDNFSQCQQRLDRLPPSYLRPRRYTESLQVFPIQGVSEIEFDVVNQRLTAVLKDHRGDVAAMEAPFYDRGTNAFNEFEKYLREHGSLACFISGHVRVSRGCLTIQPLSIVFQMNAEERTAASPWLGATATQSGTTNFNAQERASTGTPIHDFVSDLQTRLAETLIIGLHTQPPEPYRELAEASERLGFARLPILLKALDQEICQRSEQRNWKSNQAIHQFAQLTMLLRVME